MTFFLATVRLDCAAPITNIQAYRNRIFKLFLLPFLIAFAAFTGACPVVISFTSALDALSAFAAFGFDGSAFFTDIDSGPTSLLEGTFPKQPLGFSLLLLFLEFLVPHMPFFFVLRRLLNIDHNIANFAVDNQCSKKDNCHVNYSGKSPDKITDIKQTEESCPKNEKRQCYATPFIKARARNGDRHYFLYN